MGTKGSAEELKQMLKSSQRETQDIVPIDTGAIYTITTLNIDVLRTRCIGFYFDASTAIEEVLNNSCDMYECGYYPYCVIEEIKPGLYFYPRIEIWFKWDKEKEKYLKIDDKPEEYKDVAGFAFG